MLVEDRPHRLRVVTYEDGHYEGRYWVEGTPSYSEFIPCRYEVNGKASEIVLPNGDGVKCKYSYTIYLDVMDLSVSLGQAIQIFNKEPESGEDATPVAELPVKGFNPRQLRYVIWI